MANKQKSTKIDFMICMPQNVAHVCLIFVYANLSEGAITKLKCFLKTFSFSTTSTECVYIFCAPLLGEFYHRTKNYL